MSAQDDIDKINEYNADTKRRAAGLGVMLGAICVILACIGGVVAMIPTAP